MVISTYDTPSANKISLDHVVQLMQSFRVLDIYVKKLAPNDNSKNQPYLGGHLTDLPFIPTDEITASKTNSQKTSKTRIKYQASLNLNWVDAGGVVYPAPNAKLIYYPQYPEVRLSGFLSGSKVDISYWMSPDKKGRSDGRWLILGVNKKKEIYAYLATPQSNLSEELLTANYSEVSQKIWKLKTSSPLSKKSTRDELIHKLTEVHNMGWIPSQKLSSDLIAEKYSAPNGGGYTLEAMLGIRPNGIAEPDFLGWEVKQFGVTKFPRSGSKPTTLMTPEPNGGYYSTSGAIEFVKSYGYPDKNGKKDRINFGGRHLIGHEQSLTHLTMDIIGFDHETSTITDASGAIVLLDKNRNVTASWSFAKLMDHWKRKHSQAVYIPCMKRTESGTHLYHYGKDIELGTGTSFEMVLSAMYLGSVYYDPGIKLENASSDKPKIKRRSQFRVNHKHLSSLYRSFEFLDLSL